MKAHKKSANKNKVLVSKRDPSYSPLPPKWTTEYRNTIPYQINKKHANYNLRLAAVHKYKDNTRNMMRKIVNRI
jgi:hypothetical protein